ncbi:MAG: alpha/beta fold hydrolase [bacterium]|nr:alpha/beta fold hydrolase [bacterium]
MKQKYVWVSAAAFLSIAIALALAVYTTGEPGRYLSLYDAGKEVDTFIGTEHAAEFAPGAPDKDEKPAFHALSIPALAAWIPDGRNFTVGRLLDDNTAYRRYYITYESEGLTISGIMNVPKGEGIFPLLLLNHGHIDTAVYTNGRGLKREQDYLARRGYVVIHSDYRNHAFSGKDPDTDVNFRLGYAKDVINAAVAVKMASLPFIDAERIGVLGHSMGGGVALAMMTAKPELARGYVLFAPVSGDARKNYERWMLRRPETAERIASLYGAPDANPSFWDGISPVTHLTRTVSPVMIHHGTNDESVPLEWSEALAVEMRDAEKNPLLYVYEGEPHEFINAWPLVMQRTTEFFDMHVRGAASAKK